MTFGAGAGHGGHALIEARSGDGSLMGGMAVDGRGQIVAALTTTRGAASRMTVAGWNADGDVDRRFGPDGTRDLGVPSPDDGASRAFAVAIGAEDRIVVAGAAVVEGAVEVGRPTLVRLDADGNPDATFGPGGVRTLLAPSGFSGAWLRNVAVDSDGRIVTTAALREGVGGSPREGVGIAGASASSDEIVVLDQRDKTVFDIAGLVVTDASATVAVNRRSFEGPSSTLLGRFVPGSGAPPARLLDDAAAFPAPFSATALAPGSDGALFVFGTSGLQVVVARVDSSGALDTSFGDAGLAPLNIGDAFLPDGDSSAWRAEVTPLASLRHSNGGLYVVASVVVWEAGSNFADKDYVLVLRMTENGALDATFGSNGMVVLRASTDPSPRVSVLHAAISIVEDRCRGRILVGGSSDLGPVSFAIWP